MFSKNKNHIKKITSSILLLVVLFNSTAIAKAGQQEIEEYCEKQLGADWRSFKYNPEKSDYKEKTFSEIRNKYHEDINKLFDDSTQKMIDAVEGENDLAQICTETSITKKVKKAVSTYEISQMAFCRYARYKHILDAKSGDIVNQNINDPDIQALLKNPDDNLQTDYFEALQLYQDEMATELDIAKISLENALAVYDEMMLMYPLHMRFRCIISDLLKFREHLAKLINIFFCLDRYINASSDKVG